MSNPEHLAKLKEGVEAWNPWRKVTGINHPQLSEAWFNGANLRGANLFGAILYNAQTNLLFVKSSGLAGGITHETWLFEYDLLGQRLIERRRVADGALPTECPESP